MKTILVTGASSGLGKAIALGLLDEGHRVYGAARRVEAMAELEDRGGVALAMDITSEEDVDAVVDRVEADGGVDVLINNAGFGLYGPVERTDIDDARYQLEVNLFGLAGLTRRLIPAMRERGSGRIINMSSMGGRIHTPLGAWYHASKHALEGWSDCLRMELEPFGIRVVIIEPGIIETGFDDAMIEPMLERTEDSPYAELGRRVARATRGSYDSWLYSSPPEAVVETVRKAVEARRPRTRYPAGRPARLLMFLRRWLPDRVYDRLMLSQL